MASLAEHHALLGYVRQCQISAELQDHGVPAFTPLQDPAFTSLLLEKQ
jgi:hypothetical protein